MFKSDIDQEYDDLLMKMALSDYSEELGEQLLAELEEIKDDPLYQGSIKEKRRFRHQLNIFFKKDNVLNLVHKVARPMKKVAAFFLVAGIALSIPMFTVEAFRINVFNFFYDVHDTFTEIKGENNDSYSVSGPIYRPTYIPEGFSITKEDEFGADYENADGKIITYFQLSATGTLLLDSENAEIFKPIKIRGQDGLIIVKGGVVTLAWQEEEYFFNIIGEISKEEAFKIAESVSIV